MFKKVTITLYAIAILVMAMATCFSQHEADVKFYGTWWFTALWALLAAAGVAWMIVRKVRRPSIILLHSSFVIILLGALLTRVTGIQSSIHLRKDVTTNALENNTTLPFSITLKDFTVEYHNGTQAPSDFVSSIEIADDDATEPRSMHKVSMNNIVSYSGIRLYQSGYDPDMLGARLSVNIDPYGIPVTYFGYAMLFLTLIWTLIDKRGGFRYALRQLSSMAKPTVMLLISVFFTALSAMAEESTLHVIPPSQAEQMGTLNIRYNERICPLQTFAIDFTKKITGSRSFEGCSAEQVLTGFIFFPNEWNKVKCIKIKSDAIRERYNLGDYASLMDFFSFSADGNMEQYILAHELQEAYWGNDDKLHQDVEKLDEKVMLIMQLQYSQSLMLFPYEGRWLSPVDSLPDTMPQEQRDYIHKAITILRDYAATSDWEQFTEMVSLMRKYQYRYGADSIPSDFKISAERIYNNIPFATILFMVCLATALLSLWRRKWVKIASYSVLCVSWLALTFCLALRWIVSGTVPMSNGYETMLLLAWFFLLLPIVCRRFIFPSLLLAGFSLLVSHISQLDPQITHIMPVLQSPLLTIHVMIIMMSYALLAMTTLCSVYALIARCRKKDIAYYRYLGIAFLYPAIVCLGIGIFIGAIWANVSWGTYWSWDPKETWALITFLIYAIPLHRLSLPSMNRPMVYHVYMIVAFLSVVITYFGVNYLLGGMHSYA